MKPSEVSRSYREAEIRGANSVECTIMLYDIVIADLRKAIECLAGGDIEGRTQALVHGLNALGYLQGTLQMDTGGEAARQLYHFYSLARAKVLEGQIKCRARLFEEIIDAMQKIRALWVITKDNCAEPAPASLGPWAAPIEEASSRGAWSA